MIRSWPWLAVGGLTFGICTFNLLAQGEKPPVPAAKLPLTRVVLSNAGIGYFHREGTVDGTARVDLTVNEEDVNDLILTLLASDPQGAARAVSYDNRAPAEIALKSFSVDLAANPSVGSLLHQVRGEKVEITHDDKTAIVGSIVSVQTAKSEKDEIVHVNVMTDDGLTSVPLAKVRRVKFVKPELQAEFRRALEALAASRTEGRKTVGVTFNGQGPRKVSIGYVAEAPLWKPTYRLSLSPQGAALQCLAAVENTTDEDWQAIGVKLMSHRPITYRMDLYEPLYMPRPLVEPELYASLRPPVYQAATPAMGGFGALGGLAGQGAGVLGATGLAQNLGAGGGVVGVGGGQFGQFGNVPPSPRAQVRQRLTYEELVERRNGNTVVTEPAPQIDHPTAAAAANLGEAFEYAIKDPVTLPRFKSALLPVLDEKVETEPLSIYNPAVQQDYPLKGLRLKNTSKLFLAAGPLVVYEGDGVAGQARLADVKPGESRLLSYAIDLDVKVKQEETATSTPAKLSIHSGQLWRRSTSTAINTYTAKNQGPARTLWITQAIKPDWKLIEPAKPVEQSAELYRFELKLPANASAAVAVKETREETLGTPLEKLPEISDLIANPATPQPVREALSRLKAMEQELADVLKSLAAEAVAREQIVKDQERQRANLATLPKESEAYKRYVKNFDDQETELEKQRVRVKALEVSREKLAGDLAALRKDLKAE